MAIIIVFNLALGLASGYVATRIFNHRGFSTNPEDNIKAMAKGKKDILTIAFYPNLWNNLFLAIR